MPQVTDKFIHIIQRAVVVVIVWQLDLQLPMQSVPTRITTKVVSPNPAHGEVYWMQHYVNKFVSDLRHNGVFLLVLRFPPLIKQTATINRDEVHLIQHDGISVIQYFGFFHELKS
jgi:hypothetical protein